MKDQLVKRSCLLNFILWKRLLWAPKCKHYPYPLFLIFLHSTSVHANKHARISDHSLIFYPKLKASETAGSASSVTLEQEGSPLLNRKAVEETLSQLDWNWKNSDFHPVHILPTVWDFMIKIIIVRCMIWRSLWKLPCRTSCAGNFYQSIPTQRHLPRSIRKE